MVAAGLGISISRDPVTVVAMKLLQVIVPVRSDAQGVSDKGAHDRAGSSILNGGFSHGSDPPVVRLDFGTNRLETYVWPDCTGPLQWRCYRE
jgi:hypothetical protein